MRKTSTPRRIRVQLHRFCLQPLMRTILTNLYSHKILIEYQFSFTSIRSLFYFDLYLK